MWRAHGGLAIAEAERCEGIIVVGLYGVGVVLLVGCEDVAWDFHAVCLCTIIQE